MPFQEGLDARRERNHPALGQLPIRPTFAVDHQPVVLPVEVICGEVGQFRHSKAGIQKCLDD